MKFKFSDRASISSAFITILFVIIILGYGISTFWIGFHNLDLAQNMRY